MGIYIGEKTVAPNEVIGANTGSSALLVATDDTSGAIWKLQNQIGAISTLLDQINRIVI